jgi:hypothetical protein
MYRYLTPEQTQAIEGAGVPVDSTHPQWCWLVSLYDASEMPTDLEIRQLRSIAEYRLSQFREHYQQVIREKAYNSAREKGKGNLLCDGGVVTHVFTKGSPYVERIDLGQKMKGWHFRRSTWTGGPLFVPWRSDEKDKDTPPLTLVEAVDRMYSIPDGNGETKVFGDWAAWKAAHPEIFPTTT